MSSEGIDGLPARVLLVPSASIPSGVMTYVLDEARAIGRACTVLATPGSALARSLPEGTDLLATGPRTTEMVKAMAPHRTSYDFVHAHGPRALLAATLAGVPSASLGYVFHEIAGRHARLETLLARRTLPAANAPETAAWARSRLGTEVDVLPPVVGLEADRLGVSVARDRLGVRNGELVVGVVGRLSAVKFPVLAVEAVASSGLDATLVFVGEGPEREAILAAGRRLGVRVVLPGLLERAAALVVGFDVGLSCSPRESFGLAAAETVVAGVPLVAVDSPGLRLLSDGGRLLALVPARREAIGAALAQAVKRPRDSSPLRSFIIDAFGPSAYAAKLDAHLRRAGRRARRA